MQVTALGAESLRERRERELVAALEAVNHTPVAAAALNLAFSPIGP
jgi:hypothetical protein